MADGAGVSLPDVTPLGEASAGGSVVFSEELGAEICARVAAGETLTSVCEAPGMPHRLTVNVWSRKHPAFGAAMRAARLAARTARRALERAEAARWMARPKRRSGRKPMYSPALGEAICERLADGESLLAISRDPAMPGAPTVFRWVRQYPEFEAMYVTARQEQADYLVDEAREVALAATPKSVWADRLRFDTIRWMTARLAPKKYCEPVVVAGAVAELKAQDDPRRQPLQVIVKRFSDVTPQEQAEAEATEALFERRGW